MVADTWLSRHDDELITAIVAVAGALLLAWLLDRALTRMYASRPRALREPKLDTRLRFLRRLLETAIIVAGVLIALSQFAALDEIATSLLASGAIVAAIVGFAARQSIANAVAGMSLAVSQPLRIGDVVTFGDETGTVQDIRLTATYLRAADGTVVVIPNEMLAGGILRNQTREGPSTTAEASIWIPLGGDAPAALAAVQRALPDDSAVIAETTAEGIRLAVARKDVPVTERAAVEAELRRTGLAALTAKGAQPPG
jgi:small-conductance mechanosensitive channel